MYKFKNFGNNKAALEVITNNSEKKETFDYYESLAKGKKAETEFKDKFCVQLEPSSEWAYDFYMPTLNGTVTVELKSDNYTNTPNFAIEQIRDVELNTPGGPWQSDSVLFIYFFKNQNKYYFFETATLVQHLDELLKTRTFREVYTSTYKNNRTYQTKSLLIPINLLQPIGLEFSEEHLAEYKTEQLGTLTNGYYSKPTE